MTVEAPAKASPLDDVVDGERDDAADHATLVGLADEAPTFDGDDVGFDDEVAGRAHLLQ